MVKSERKTRIKYSKEDEESIERLMEHCHEEHKDPSKIYTKWENGRFKNLTWKQLGNKINKMGLIIRQKRNVGTFEKSAVLTKQEEKEFVEMIERFNKEEKIVSIAYKDDLKFGYLNYKQFQKIRTRLCPTKKLLFWSEEEVEKLKKAFETHKFNFEKISKELGRSKRQCHSKLRNMGLIYQKREDDYDNEEEEDSDEDDDKEEYLKKLICDEFKKINIGCDENSKHCNYVYERIVKQNKMNKSEEELKKTIKYIMQNEDNKLF